MQGCIKLPPSPLPQGRISRKKIKWGRREGNGRRRECKGEKKEKGIEREEYRKGRGREKGRMKG